MALDCVLITHFLSCRISFEELNLPTCTILVAFVLGETSYRGSNTFLCGQALGQEHCLIYSENVSKHTDEFGISVCW